MDHEKDCRYPRVLIIGNNCLSQSGSNGRTMRNFLDGWPKEALAQFYIYDEDPDFEVCDHYYRVTDRQALRALLGKGKSGGVVTQARSMEASSGTGMSPRRNAFTMLCRELIWDSCCWGRKELDAWISAFDPQVVLLQAGDCSFMFRIARQVAKAHGIPLMIYNSEGYYFKKHDYFQAKGLIHWLYPLFRLQFCREFRRTMKVADQVVYICETLMQDYQKEFSTPSQTIYTATTMTPAAEKKSHEGFIVSYLGQLSVGRHKPLAEVACTLQEVAPGTYLDVYGRVTDSAIRKELENSPGIRLKGFVPYEQVVEIMQQSDLLIHGESGDPFFREDLKYGFSTKIPDSLASGTCFLLYAPEELACAQYLIEQQAAYVVTEKEKLKDTLRLLVNDPEARKCYFSRAAEVVRKNHTTDICAKRFQEILRKAANQ